jgi:hypothetical protein
MGVVQKLGWGQRDSGSDGQRTCTGVMHLGHRFCMCCRRALAALAAGPGVNGMSGRAKLEPNIPIL